MEQVTLRAPDISCDHCIASIQKAVTKLNGVRFVKGDAAAKQVYKLLAQEENRHYEILQSSRDYLTDNQTWWDDEQLPFFTG